MAAVERRRLLTSCAGLRAHRDRARGKPGTSGPTGHSRATHPGTQRSTTVRHDRSGGQLSGQTTLWHADSQAGVPRGANPERTVKSLTSPDDTSRHGSARQTARGGTSRPTLRFRFHVRDEEANPDGWSPAVWWALRTDVLDAHGPLVIAADSVSRSGGSSAIEASDR
jgi:hypothetical protein